VLGTCFGKVSKPAVKQGCCGTEVPQQPCFYSKWVLLRFHKAAQSSADYPRYFLIASAILSRPVIIIDRGMARLRRIYPLALPTNRASPPSRRTPALLAKN